MKDMKITVNALQTILVCLILLQIILAVLFIWGKVLNPNQFVFICFLLITSTATIVRFSINQKTKQRTNL